MSADSQTPKIASSDQTEPSRQRPSWGRRLATIGLPAVFMLISVLIVYKLTRRYEPPVIPETSFIRQAPPFQLYDQTAKKLVRAQRYIGRQKFLVAFIDGSQGTENSAVATEIRRNWKTLDASGGAILGITNVRPEENRNAIERSGEFPFVLLSDLNHDEVYRLWGAYDVESEKVREGVVIVDRQGLIRFVHYTPGSIGTPEIWARELRQVR